MLGVMGRWLAVVTALLASAACPARAQQTVPGVLALAGAEATVTGQLVAVETTPLVEKLQVIFADKATGDQIDTFTEELTQQLHLLAIDSTLSTLVHEHVRAVSADGTFKAEMHFPKPGLYHIYADAVPEGHGQQVLRFDVRIGDEAAEGSGAGLRPFHINAVISISSEPYELRLDASGLRPNEEGELTVDVMKDGQPANDLHPYLGVAAHAVLIKAADLAYVHAHPTASGDPMHDMGTGMDHAGHGGEHAATASSGGAQIHEHGHSGAGTSVSPNMTLHLTPSGAGNYTLFFEFIGGDKVHTVAVPFELLDGITVVGMRMCGQLSAMWSGKLDANAGQMG